MKKFLIVLLIVLIAIATLAACAPVKEGAEGVVEFAKSMTDHAVPTWLIIVGAIIVFFIGFGLIWRLIPGFIKFIALLVLAIAIAGAAYGIWTIPAYDKAKEIYDEVSDVVEVVTDQNETTETQ